VPVVLLERGHDVVVQKASVWRRVRMRLLATRWDRDLAAGVSPDTTVEHSLRAQHLATPAQRTVTATALWRCLDEAVRRPRRPVAPRSGVLSPGVRRNLLACAGEISQLAARLDSPAPVAPRGLAQSRQLVTDGAGPLHYAVDHEQLRLACLQALGALELDLTEG